MACRNLDIEPCPSVELYGDLVGLWPCNYKSAKVIETHFGSTIGGTASLAELLDLLVPSGQRGWRLDHVLSASEVWVSEREAVRKMFAARDEQERKRKRAR